MQAPTLLNSWVVYDAVNYTSPGFWRDGFGMVHLEGMIKNGTLNAVAFTLPVGFRPKLLRLFAVDSNLAHGRVIVYPTGNVEVAGSAVYLSLDGVSFRAA